MGLLHPPPPPLARFFPALCRNHFTSLQFTYDRRVCRPPLVRSPFGRSISRAAVFRSLSPPCPLPAPSSPPPSQLRRSPFRPSLATGRGGRNRANERTTAPGRGAATPPNCMTRAPSTKGALAWPVHCIADQKIVDVRVLCRIRPLAVMSLLILKTLPCSFRTYFSNSTVSHVHGS